VAQPRLVAQIEHAEWTDDNHLRHSKFFALLDDRDVGVVGRELPTPNRPSPSPHQLLFYSNIQKPWR
jgi:ATP-dependent DNA ligase